MKVFVTGNPRDNWESFKSKHQNMDTDWW